MIIGLIPARLKSTRIPNKPLTKIDGLPLVVNVMRRAMMSKMLDKVIVCADDIKIVSVVRKFGGKAILTDKKFKNGTERIGSLIGLINQSKLVVDIQCDELFLSPKLLDKAIKFHISNKIFDIVVPHSLISRKMASNKNVVKIISNDRNKILYMTRTRAPSFFKYKKKKFFQKHLDFITFMPNSLKKFSRIRQSRNELAEGIELNRALDNNFNLGTLEMPSDSFSINTKKDLKIAKKLIKKCSIRKKY